MWNRTWLPMMVSTARHFLECMAWGGTGLVWSLVAGVPTAELLGEAHSGRKNAMEDFSFVQIDDSHTGFNVSFHTAMSTAFPQPAPGDAPRPGPMEVPAGKLESVLGVTDVKIIRGHNRLAVVDSSLEDMA
jgi:hypothetical protein